MPSIQLASSVIEISLPPSAVPSAVLRLKEWELVEFIAAGEDCEIHRARPAGAPADQSPAYAVKSLRSLREQDYRAVARLRREALVGRRVANPHVVAVLSASLRDAPYFLVMPWLAGETLRVRMARLGASPVHWSLWVARQIAMGLSAIDAQGWLHGDVKPDNVLVSPEGHVTLLDLGFARRPGEVQPAADDCVLGTAEYMAPELLFSAMRADIRSDLYSLGGVLYELLAGRPPFVGRSRAELVRQHKQDVPPRLDRVAPHVPGQVAALVHQMLAKDPLRRPQSPEELVERLAKLEIVALRDWTA
jgi:serine/threonine-protein kinase